MIAGGRACKIDFQGAGKLLPDKFGITFRRYTFYGDLMADIAYAAYVIRDDQADQVISRFTVGVIWAGAVAFVIVPKIPMKGYDIMFTGRGAVEMDLKCTGDLFPGKLSIAIRLYCLNGYFVTDVIHATKIICDDQANQVCSGLRIGVVWT